MRSLIVLFLILGFNSYSQISDEPEMTEYENCADEINVSDSNYIQSKVKGYELMRIDMSQCDENDESYYQYQRVKKIIKTDSSYIYHLDLKKNCCTGIKASIRINNDTLDFLFDQKGVFEGCGECACNCLFCAKYEVLGNTKFANFKIRGKSVKFTDTPEYWRRVEKEFWENGKRKSRSEYIENVLRNRYYYYENGKLKTMESFDKTGRLTQRVQFDMNGKRTKTNFKPKG